MIDKKDDALKLALETLEDWAGGIQRLNAITAIREALAEQTALLAANKDLQNHFDALMNDYKKLSALCSSQGTRLMEYESSHEPVAYLDEGLGAFYWAKDYKKDVGFTPLYTSPPIEATPLANANAGKPWAGLDNDDLVWIYSNSDNVGQAISNTESKLKEKNT